MAKAMLIDTSKCTACRGCQVACKQWNDLPGGETRNRGSYQNPPQLSINTWKLVTFNEVSEGEQVRWLFLPMQCVHCTQASCVSVCPTGAAHYLGEFVVIDQNQCIGCGYCVMACPFGVPHSGAELGEEKATARKCTFCLDRVSNGYIPACAKTCPAGAYSFGEREEFLALGQERVEFLKADGHPNAYLYGASELGGLHVMFVLKERPSLYGLPENPRYATANVLGQWLGGIITAGVVAALPFWLLFKRKEALAAEKSAEKSEGGKAR
ncbi:MAG: 4Fe-4S dicluster domain-containing protein [Anaerolineae bacterium]